MKYINNSFSVEKVKIQKLANKFETPFYCYSFNKLKKNINKFKFHFKSISPLICFALKANSNLQIIKEVKKLGLGADVVSKGELLFTGPMVDHAMFYTEETEIIVLSKNPRDQKTYEADTVRIDFMNDKNRF